ncbi:MAG: hypothetical protein ACRDTF_04890 [Pseudonocardiaceae bacterium]
MAYHGDVEFLEDCNPALIERNAEEFARMRDLLVSMEPSVNKAKNDTIWESAYREQYDARLADVRALVTGLADGFDKARTALLAYADEIERAKRHLENGQDAEARLDELVSSVASALTRTAQKAEPMRRWEDIRERGSIFSSDFWAELGMDVGSIREDATRAYEQADEAFGRAKSIEKKAREECLAKLKAAYEALPDFRGGNFKNAINVIGSITTLLDEAAQARSDPHARLAGSGEKGDNFPGAGKAAVSPALQRIRDLLKSLPEGEGDWLHDEAPGGKENWIKNNKELINAAAAETGLPPDLIAGIAWQEVGDKLKDPAQNIFIASEYLANLKAESEFAPVPADHLTTAQYEELAARYNGGPNWQGDHAQDYGKDVMKHLHKAGEALR